MTAARAKAEQRLTELSTAAGPLHRSVIAIGKASVLGRLRALLVRAARAYR